MNVTKLPQVNQKKEKLIFAASSVEMHRILQVKLEQYDILRRWQCRNKTITGQVFFT